MAIKQTLKTAATALVVATALSINTANADQNSETIQDRMLIADENLRTSLQKLSDKFIEKNGQKELSAGDEDQMSMAIALTSVFCPPPSNNNLPDTNPFFEAIIREAEGLSDTMNMLADDNINTEYKECIKDYVIPELEANFQGKIIKMMGLRPSGYSA